MPRTHRLDFPGARHHVMNRATRHEAVFVDDRTCALFVDALATFPRDHGVRVHGYALMPNHFHLMLETPDGNLSRAMQGFGGRLTQSYNRATGGDGPVFRGRFKSHLVTDDAYWQHLLAYLHLNPVRAGLTARPEDCVWTSHAAYVGEAPQPDWLACDDLRGALGGREGVAGYVRDVHTHRRGPPPGFDPERFWDKAEARAERPAPRSIDAALADVAATLNTTVDALRTRSRGRGDPRAWVAAWWLRRATTASFTEIGRALGVTAQRAGAIVRQAEGRAVEDAGARAWMAALEGTRG